jgi:putative transcription factor
MDCEVCGKKEAVCLVHLEGAKMSACAGCARGGKVLYYFQEDSGPEPLPQVQRSMRTEESIVDGYGKAIKSAREKMGLSLEQLGLKIAEKANYLDHVERETTLPSLSLARKLEKFFRIRLVETESSVHVESSAGYGKKELTLLDVAEIERKEKKK